jgi:hypothetical protein
MPNYSLTRTTKYITDNSLQTLSNQDRIFFTGYNLEGYCSSFTVTNTGTDPICSSTNRLWDYKSSSPSDHYVWYPYSMTLACCGGGVHYPQYDPTLQKRRGYAYFKLYNNTGTYLMGSYISGSSSAYNLSYSDTEILDANWAHKDNVLVTTKDFTSSRNTLTISGTTTYHAGVSNPDKSVISSSFWTIFAKSYQPNQDVFYDSSVAATGSTSLGLQASDQCHMGYITYNNAPVQPTIVSFVTTTTGIRVTCRGDESDSLISTSGSIGAVSRVMFFYSTTSGGTYNYLGVDTSVTRTLVSGTTYQYVAEVSGGTTLQQGHSYYFKVATVNDVCIQYNSENSGSRAGSALSAVRSSSSQYGTGGFVQVYTTAGTWVNAPIYVYNSAGWQLKSSVFAKNTSTGYIYN